MNRRILLSIALACCVSCLLQAQLNTPKTGVVRYSDRTVHAVYGLPANYIVDKQVLASADAVSFSETGGLLANGGRILLVDVAFKTVAEYDSREAAPILNIDGDLKSAIAWLPSRHALLHWTGTSFSLTEVDEASIVGAVTSIRLVSANSAELLVTDNDGSVSENVISLESGEPICSQVLPGVRGPAFIQQSLFVFRDAGRLAIANSSGIVHTLPLPASSISFERSSSDSLHLASPATKQDWILHLSNAHPPQLSELPASRPPVVSPAPPITVEEAQK